ncbi:MAG: extracellular solute-binding protein [Clostridiales bacterium]|nr:extracellular solute-binding protein [Clostridiales bacterium]
MKNLKVRLGAAVMAVTLLAGTVCSCAKGKQKAKEILATDPWYSTEKVMLGTEYDPNDYQYLSPQLLGLCGGNFVTYIEGILPFPSDFDMMTDSYADYMIVHVNIYDKTGSLVKNIDLMQIAEDNGYDTDNLGLSGVSIIDDEIVCDFNLYENGKMMSIKGVIDPATGDVTSLEESEPVDEEEGGTYLESTEKIDGYTIKKNIVYSEDSELYTYSLEAIAPDGSSQIYDFSKENPEMNIISIPTMISMGDDQVLIYCQSDKKKNSKYMVYDLKANTVEEYKEDTEWLEDVTSMYETQNVEDMGCFLTKQDGIKKIDFSTKSVEDYLDFDCCNINRYDVMNLSLLSMTEDEIVLGGVVWRTGSSLDMSGQETEVIILKKAETNPNAGKTILRLAALDYFSYPLCEAIGNFNETNDKYFIEYDNSYSMIDEIDYDSILDANDQTSAINDANAKLSDRLAVDLVSGEGPDIIVDGAAFSQLNNSDYLLDLSPYLETLDTSALYSNVIDSAKEADGKLYQLPVTFAIEGIVVQADDVEEGKVGFTFDEYEEFVKGPCNGTDPMGMNQVDFFNKSAAFMNDEFYENGKVNYDCEAFKALAAYVKDNVPEKVDSGSVIMFGAGDAEPVTAQFTTMYSLADYLLSTGVIDGSTKIMGCPTYDGRGAMFTGCDSAAIYAQTASPEGCWEFIKTLLSDDAQTLFAQNGQNPLNKEALAEMNAQAIDDMNSLVDLYLSVGYTEDQLRAYGIPCDKVDETAAEAYVEAIENCTGLDRSDPSVNAILKEEMPAYFEGQKSIDDVIPIIEDRVQTFLNERG